MIQKALKLLLDRFGADYDCVTVSEEDGHYRANIEASDAARLIGKNGQVVDALQTLLKNILWTQNGENVFVSVDVDHYRKDQEDRIIEKAKRFLEAMKENNMPETKLPPMSPYFRRIVHVWILNNYPDMDSDSVGEKDARAVRIFYK